MQVFSSIVSKIIGNQNEREVRRLKPLVEAINKLEPKVSSLSDAELRAKTDEFRSHLIQARKGREAELEELRTAIQEATSQDAKDKLKLRWKRIYNSLFAEVLPEAFAVVREASRRTIGLRHFDVQLIGGIVLHEGKIAEMATGEGKTLVATLAAYLNALMGEGVHVVTVNDYLARRDREWMGPIYEFLGLSVGVIQHDMGNQARRQAYACDITYGTNNEFGFDYLRDNMVSAREEMVQRNLSYAIIDEVDSILIDEARTPLIISGPIADRLEIYDELAPEVMRLKKTQDEKVRSLIKEAERLLTSSNEEERYQGAEKLFIAKQGSPKNARLLKLLEDPQHYKLVEKVDSDYLINKRLNEVLEENLYYFISEKDHNVTITNQGRSRFSDAFQKLLDSTEMSTEKLLCEHAKDQLIKGAELFQEDVHYVVKDGEVLIVDEFTGRLMPGRRWSDGLHEAIDALERYRGKPVQKQRGSQTLATITFQNYFRIYDKISGMTGTAFTEAQEFKSIYGLEVVVIPTNRTLIRTNHPDCVYKTEKEKFKAVVEEIVQLHESGRPVLVGTISIEKSERLSAMLAKKGISHNVLNAKYHEMEAHIVAQAGRYKAVTIATNMAGRGTDILLGGNAEYMAKSIVRQLKPPPVDYEAEYQKLLGRFRTEAQKEHEQVVKAGGLHVIGTERHEARRIDNQLRGRSGRQGDPGSSRFYVSFEDDLMRLFGSDRISTLMDKLGMEESQAIEHPWVTKSIEIAQKRVESHNFEIRKQLLEYDNVMNKQREVIYSQRRLVLEGVQTKELIVDMIQELVAAAMAAYLNEELSREEWGWQGLRLWLQSHFCLSLTDEEFKQFIVELEEKKYEEIQKALSDKICKVYEEKEATVGAPMMRALEHMAILQVIDTRWKDHLYAMDSLKEGIGLRAYAHRDPLVEYQHEAFALFSEMIEKIKEESIQLIFRLQAVRQEAVRGVFTSLPQQYIHQEAPDLSTVASRVSAAEADQGSSFAPPEEDEQEAPAKPMPVKVGRKVGRNEPCPCGSGKKYKHCCGR